MLSKKGAQELEKLIGEMSEDQLKALMHEVGAKAIPVMSTEELRAIHGEIGDAIDARKQEEMDQFVQSILTKATQLKLNLNDLAPQLGITVKGKRKKPAGAPNGDSGGTPRASPKVKYRDNQGNKWS